MGPRVITRNRTSKAKPRHGKQNAEATRLVTVGGKMVFDAKPLGYVLLTALP